MTDGNYDYLCYKGIKIRMYPDKDNLGNNASAAEKTMNYSLKRNKGSHKPFHHKNLKSYPQVDKGSC